MLSSTVEDNIATPTQKIAQHEDNISTPTHKIAQHADSIATPTHEIAQHGILNWIVFRIKLWKTIGIQRPVSGINNNDQNYIIMTDHNGNLQFSLIRITNV